MFSAPSKVTYLNLNDPEINIDLDTWHSSNTGLASTERDYSRFLRFLEVSVEIVKGSLEPMGYPSIHGLSHLGSYLQGGTSWKH